MAWIVAIPPSPRHPHERYQVRFQDGQAAALRWHLPDRAARAGREARGRALGDLDASTIGASKTAMAAKGLAPRSVNTYLSLLGTILNAVDDDYLPRSPLLRRSGAGRAAATATSRCGAVRCGCPASSLTGRSRRSTHATAH